MTTQLKLRGGTTTQHSTFTGAGREVTVDTDKNTLVVHDGTTAGGFALALESSSGVPDPLSINSITGNTVTGTTSVSGGTVTATTTVTGATVTANTTLNVNNWTITESNGSLIFSTGGADKMKLDASGNLTVIGNVTGYGTI